MNATEFTGFLERVLGDQVWPKPLHILRALALMGTGQSLRVAAATAGTSPSRLQEVAAAKDPIRELTGVGVGDLSDRDRSHARQILGQLLLGRCAEMVFEEIYKSEMQAHELELRDLRESRSDTDYRLYNGQGRAIYRVNIKFHGSRFRRAPELVGLDPQDCFALATYKIHGALQKQQEERLPYIFAIVGVPEIGGESVGSQLTALATDAVALLHKSDKVTGKRNVEDAVVEHLVRSQDPVFQDTHKRIAQADWYMLSARKAEKLLRELLFDRVFALRVRGFARVFRGAELDMHFSLSRDLVPLHTFLSTLRTEGLTKVATLMERGEY